MEEITLKNSNGKKITVIRRRKDVPNYLPGEVYVQIIDGLNYIYLEKDELELILKAMKILKENSQP